VAWRRWPDQDMTTPRWPGLNEHPRTAYLGDNPVNQDLTQLLTTELKLDPQRLRPESSLEEAGLDSLGIVELSVTLSDRLGVEIADDELNAVKTLAALDRMVGERLTGR
jgi:acyl carrier protein